MYWRCATRAGGPGATAAIQLTSRLQPWITPSLYDATGNAGTATLYPYVALSRKLTRSVARSDR